MARKDNKGRNLKTGEYQRPDGRYEYRYKDEITGKRNSVYAADLVSLREMEKKINIEAVNVSALERFDNDTEVTIATLIEAGVIKDTKDGVKILGNGELTKKLTVKVNAFSEGAKAKIEALGGKAEVI